ncbi:hypothetical protein ACFU1Q_11525 [Brachybacterium paraconglomeratum]
MSFSRDGETFELGTSGLSPILHMYGSTGLGIAPVEVSDSERLGGDGSIVRGVRFGKREVYIPLRMEAETTADLSLLRRRLARLITPVSGDPAASLVDVTIQDPATGIERTARGIYKDGLDGDFGSGYHGYWQKLGLTFECPDPWWLGPEQTVELRVNPGSKPFLSDTVPFFPVVLAQSTVQGRFDVTIAGDGPVWPAWEVVGPGTDLVIARGSDRIKILGDFPAGSPVLIDTAAGRITPDRWDDTTLESVLFPLEAGRQTITVTLVGATKDTLVRLTYRERYLEGI